MRPFRATAQVPLPPGPWELPVIGSMHHLVNVLPHRALRDLAGAHGPLMMLRLGQTPLVVASSKESARAVLKTHDTNFATRPKLLAGEIVALRVAEIRAAGPSTPVNLSVMFHGLTNSIVSRAAFGKKRKNAPEFLAATKAVVGLSSGFNIPDLFPTWTTVPAKVTGLTRRLRGILKTVDTILEEIIKERKASTSATASSRPSYW
ncbi:Premnaspirodiene oxygenase [Dichanthelium oligosanthes]|uniref:Premnaspirodiene oxygenase n=1 Tax=Dichanthelium oligosanthes TaxID=888268 RepID=A0A1E5V076_9POAL|nr:Premnaspirodiene oxygenase [Dichanthelium oligosanthes]